MPERLSHRSRYIDEESALPRLAAAPRSLRPPRRHAAARVLAAAAIFAASSGCSADTGGRAGAGARGGGDPPAGGGTGGASGDIDLAIPAGGSSPERGGRDGDCGSVEIEATVEEVYTGNLLLIFDQSRSMAYDWDGRPRWQAASDAVVAAITPVQHQLAIIGAIFYPSEGSVLALFRPPTCDLDLVCAIDDTTCPNPQIPFMPASQFLDAWVAHWARDPLRLSTPMEAAFQRGLEALEGANLPGKTVVLFETDGGPWPEDPGPTCGTMAGTQALVGAIAGQGIPVYVVGVPGSQSSADWLNAIAQAGGTNQYIDAARPSDLEAAIRDVTSTVIERRLNDCAIVFDEPPADPEKVYLIVREQASNTEYQVQPGPNGWSLEGDAMSARLAGETCDDALQGRFSSITFQFGCVDAPVLR